MKKVLLLLAVVATLFSCTQPRRVVVEVTHSTDMVRMNEMVELDYATVVERLAMVEGESLVVLDAEGVQMPYQVTFDGKLIFIPSAIEPNSCGRYRIEVGEPDTFAVRACGAQYPERVDDIAWENGCIAFRTYGPALPASGERAYGYDAWVKCVDYPVVADRYASELNPETVAEIARLKLVDAEAAAALYNSVSYHVDHGNGLDYYKVGPTLGAGTSALLDAEGKIVYPYCYEDYEILDNGPLRFTVSLRYRPTVYGTDTIVETRVITLNEGSQLNRIDVKYHNLTTSATVVSGIVLHDVEGVMCYDAEAGYAAYAEPVDSLNGRIYLGMAFTDAAQQVGPQYFDEAERADCGAEGHLLLQRIYEPGDTFTYYAGAGWSKWGFETVEDWEVYMKYYAATLASPLEVTIK